MNDIDDTQAPLLEHLIELRRRLFYCLATLVVCFFVALYFERGIFSLLVRPLAQAGQQKLVYTQIGEAFFVQVKVALFAAIMVGFPVVANQLWQFVAPGLYRQEKRALLPFLFATPVLFLAGASMAYFIAIPVALRFLLGYHGDVGSGVQQEALPSIGNYLDFVMKFLFAFGVSFLLPVLMMLIERSGLVSRKQFVSVRRYAIVGAFILAAVMTPPDVGSQLLLAIPLVGLYEIGLAGMWFTERRRARESKANEAA